MTNIQTMEITSTNTSSGSYEQPGNSNKADAFLIGDKIETALFPTNTLESSFTIE